jgi:hypothetical protein
MKTIFTAVWNFLQEVGHTRAAAAMARSGNFASAQEMMK